MLARDFCYWLQGYFEINDARGEGNRTLTSEEVKVIRNHLNMVFIHDIDPQAGSPEHQEKLNKAHAAGLASSGEKTVLRC